MDRNKEFMPVRWMKPVEAAIYARVTLCKVRQWIAEGILPVAVTRNKKDLHGKGACGYVLDRNDLDNLLEQLKIRAGRSAVPRASGRIGPQRKSDRDGCKSTPQPAPNGPYATQGPCKKRHPGEPD